MMNKYFVSFLQRGIAFSGFGPIVAGIIFLILSFTVEDFSLSGEQVFVAILSTYVLAFIHAGVSAFWQIEHWSFPRTLACHFLCIYAAYLLCYTVNSWIPFETVAILIFTALFAVAYVVVWLTVYLIVKSVSKRINEKLS